MPPEGHIYDQLGVRRVLNAAGHRTVLGGSTLSPRVLRAMEEANQSFVEMGELLDRAGVEVARLLGVEAALITSGAAAALVLATAGLLAGRDRERTLRLPVDPGPRREVVLQRASRYFYDRCVTLAGARLVEAGEAEGEVTRAIGPRTVALLYLAEAEGRPGVLPLEEALRVAHSRGVPVLVDAAPIVFPLERMLRLARLGDLVCFGAKYFNGPNSAGILCGRRELVEMARYHDFVHYELEENGAIGRPMKVDRQEVVAVVEALREWLTMDHRARLEALHGRVVRAMELLDGLPGVELVPLPPEGPHDRLVVRLRRPGVTAEGVLLALRQGEPPIWLDELEEPQGVAIVTHSLREGEVEVVARRLREVLGG